MTINGKTQFTYLKSSINKTRVETALFLVRQVRCKTAWPLPVPDCRGRDFKQKPGGVKAAQSAHHLLVQATFHTRKLGQHSLAL